MSREVIVKRTTDGSLYLDLPSDILLKYGWEDGDDIEWTVEDTGIFLRKIESDDVEQ
jgi:bifunctional DNA-binding transcriptional regulator/antitoxin component of YhaV-PrlF toxin-antitoxin module